MALAPETDTTDLTCASMSGNIWNSEDGCEIIFSNSTHVIIETTHFSYFTLTNKKVNRAAPPPLEEKDDDKEDCGESTAPIFVVTVIIIVFTILAGYGQCKDKQHKDWPY